jgi:hypothetical protein
MKNTITLVLLGTVTLSGFAAAAATFKSGFTIANDGISKVDLVSRFCTFEPSLRCNGSELAGSPNLVDGSFSADENLMQITIHIDNKNTNGVLVQVRMHVDGINTSGRHCGWVDEPFQIYARANSSSDKVQDCFASLTKGHFDILEGKFEYMQFSDKFIK